jgi:hypothetical protein
MEDQLKVKEATLKAFRRFGFLWDTNSSKTDFEMLCFGLNLFLCICGNGITIVPTSALGEKVKLSEKIISALEDAGCKTGLQAHQLSGLDWKAILPVVE